MRDRNFRLASRDDDVNRPRCSTGFLISDLSRIPGRDRRSRPEPQLTFGPKSSATIQSALKSPCEIIGAYALREK